MLLPSLQHLRDYNITWSQHNIRALKWAWKLFTASIALLIHGFCPWIFEKYASSQVFMISSEMENCVKELNK